MHRPTVHSMPLLTFPVPLLDWVTLFSLRLRPADARHCNLNDAPSECRFAPCIKEVKEHIDMLIDKEYIERVRDDEQHATYRYLA
jgi:hypothetical protein